MSEKTYRIGEAAALLKLKSYVLRFWEVEFPQISPLRTEKGQRLYREEDLAVLRRIRHLLHERGLTIEGARRILAGEAAGSKDSAPSGNSGGSEEFTFFPDEDNCESESICSSESAAEATAPELVTELESIRNMLKSLDLD